MMEAKRAEALERLLDVAVRLHENGTLDLLENLSEVSSEALSYLTDPKVLKIWANIAYFLHFLELMDPTIISVMGNNFIKATGEIMTQETFKNPPKVGISGIIRELGDPDVQRALGFIFLMLKALGRSIDTSGKQLTALMEQMEKQFEMMRKQREEMGI